MKFKNKAMKKGQIVTVYVNPATRENVEGEAELLYYVSKNMGVYDGHPMEYWKIRFISDGWTGFRFILNVDKKVISTGPALILNLGKKINSY